MIQSNYYQNYQGPNLMKATLNNDDITELILEKYGQSNNWNGKLYHFSDIFGNDSLGKKFYCEFKDDTGRKHWFYSFVNDLNQYFNPPLATPMNQSL